MRNIRPATNSAIRAEEQPSAGGAVRIAGYANRFGKVDTYGTRFDPKSVRLERFNQNGILLFNHDVNMPVGKVTKVESRDDGVWVECELSSSDNPQVSYVRDLVREGCLKTFSMRFGDDCKMEKDPEMAGVTLIRNWELQEVSIVSLPAQPDSTFSLRRARGLLSNCRSLDDARVAVQNVRGAKVAKYVADKLTEAAKADGVEREDIMERLRDRSGLEAGALAAALEGEVTPAPAPFLSACVEVLGCDKSELDALNAQDVEADAPETAKPGDGQRSDAPPEDDKEPERADPVMDEKVVSCITGKLPGILADGKAPDEAVAMAIQMCSSERGCTGWRPSRAHMETFLRQATQEPTETTPVSTEVPNDNAMLQKLDALASLLGALVEEVKGLKSVMTEGRAAPVPPAKPDEKKPDEKKPDDEARGEDKMDPETERAINEAFARIDSRLQALGV